MKKNVVWSLALLLMIGGLIAYLFSPRSPFTGLHEIVAPPTSVMSYIPAVFDQVLILDVDDALREVALMSNDLEERDSFIGLLNSLEEVVVYQGSTPDAVHNVLIMEGNEQFSIEEVVALGVVAADETYDYVELDTGIRAYGSEAGLRYLQSSSSEKAIDSETFRVFDRARRSGKYNVGFFSRPVLDNQNNPLATQFAQRLEYTYLLSHINKEDPSGRLTMQLADGTIKSGGKALKPSVVNGLKEKPGFFFEVSDLLGIAGIDAAQVQLFAPALLAQMGTGAGIDPSDIDTLAGALQGNIAVVLTPSALSPAQLGGHIVFEDPELFGTLKKMSPALKGMVDMITGGAGLMQMEQKETETELTYAITTGTGDAAVSFPLLQLVQNPDNTTLSILTEGQLSYTNEGVLSVPVMSQDTRMRFGWDAGLLQQNFLQAQIGQGENTAQQLFQTGTIHGTVDIVAETQQVDIEFFTVQ